MFDNFWFILFVPMVYLWGEYILTNFTYAIRLVNMWKILCIVLYFYKNSGHKIYYKYFVIFDYDGIKRKLYLFGLCFRYLYMFFMCLYVLLFFWENLFKIGTGSQFVFAYYLSQCWRNGITYDGCRYIVLYVSYIIIFVDRVLLY